MSFKILNYNEVLASTLNQRKHLLLGNGFSMSYNKDRFSFTSLLENAVDRGLISETSPIYSVFKEFDTKDFEEVVKLLETSVKVLNEYGAISKNDEETILKDSKLLKEYLVAVITNNHPEKITDISNSEYLSSASFIKEYERVYTLNYDLLLYWSGIKLKSFLYDGTIKESNLKIYDGFNDPYEHITDYVVFENGGKSFNMNFLHGGLHIFDNKSEIIKNTYSRTDRTLKSQTLENLNKDIYPIFVSEGTSEQKKSKIIHNAYLNHCYKSLKSIGAKTKEESLIIFGTLLKMNDTHIRDAILKNNVRNIYIGVYNKDEVNEFEDFIEFIAKNELNKNVYFYDSKTVKVWR